MNLTLQKIKFYFIIVLFFIYLFCLSNINIIWAKDEGYKKNNHSQSSKNINNLIINQRIQEQLEETTTREILNENLINRIRRNNEAFRILLEYLRTRNNNN
ncbi:MAG: putative secreted protein [Candidatus Phytoplasma cynodontis]|nr:MAG: putative secreted protein [Candidatus Phytoplasma cynodontis]